LSKANPEYRHAYMVKRDTVKNIGLIVVSSDKGLCGGLNTNVLRLSLNQMKAWESSGQGVAISAIGNKGFGFMNRVGGKVKSHLIGLGDKPHMDRLIGPVKVMLDAYVAGEIDQLFISFTRFINTMKQEPVLEQLLPLSADQLSDGEVDSIQGPWDYIYEPDAKLVLDDLMTRYIESLIFHAVAENMASEQSARMVAMKSASDNAKNVIGELKLVYNKARQ